MGCDIHETVERAYLIDGRIWSWHNAGSCLDGRYYAFFSALGNQGRGDAPLIRPDWAWNVKRLLSDGRDPEAPYYPFDVIPCPEFLHELQSWGVDAHTVGMVTLADLKRYSEGRYLKYSEMLDSAISYMEMIRSYFNLTDEQVRMCYFMDN